ncbi:MAG: hypothetical protein Q4A19_06345, partial [Johnsonella sp.]|nr:hypothetical protein [Johnsonella sp.]
MIPSFYYPSSSMFLARFIYLCKQGIYCTLVGIKTVFFSKIPNANPNLYNKGMFSNELKLVLFTNSFKEIVSIYPYGF